MKIFSTYGFFLFPKLLILTLVISFGLAGCSSAVNPVDFYSDIFQSKAARSDVLKADVENRAHSDFILRGGSLSRLPSLQTDEGLPLSRLSRLRQNFFQNLLLITKRSHRRKIKLNSRRKRLPFLVYLAWCSRLAISLPQLKV